MGDRDKKLLPIFLKDTAVRLEAIEDFLQALEQGTPVTGAMVKSAYRAAHTIRGASALVGLSTTGALAGHLEEALEKVVRRRKIPRQATAAAMRLAFERLREQVMGTAAGQSENSDAFDEVEQVFAALPSAPPGPELQQAEGGPASAAESPTEAGTQDTVEGAGEKRSTEEPEEVPQNVCCRFRVARWEFFLPLEQMAEISTLLDITPLPLAPGYVRGLINLRGRVMPVIDLGVLRGVPAPSLADRHLVVARMGEEQLAFLTDGLPSLSPEYGGEGLDVATFVQSYGVKSG